MSPEDKIRFQGMGLGKWKDDEMSPEEKVRLEGILGKWCPQDPKAPNETQSCYDPQSCTEMGWCQRRMPPRANQSQSGWSLYGYLYGYNPNTSSTQEGLMTSDMKGESKSHDSVEHPKHYTGHPSGVECIEITRWMNFNLGNVVKYIWRAREKGSALEDLKKAKWYLEDEIGRLEGEGK